MKTIEEKAFAELLTLHRPVHVAIGMFDGVHLGHQAVIQSAIQAAALDGGLSAVLTFQPHPSHLFRPQNPTPLIYPLPTKATALREIGVDLLLQKDFDRDFASLSADEFTGWMRSVLPRLASVSVGENFRFGKGRAGDPSVLVDRLRSHGVSVFSCERVHLNGEAISSTRIRSILPIEPIEKVNTLLGRPYRSIGEIVEGKKLGRTIGFPTMNIRVGAEILPPTGVYIARFRKLNPSPGPSYPAVANFGFRPTVEDTKTPLLEVHSLEDSAADYGDTILVEWIRMIRTERKFAGLDELKSAIAQDRQKALNFFQQQPG